MMPRHNEILQIFQSPEMAPWHFRNAYNRPIPRRLAESAGIEQETFGQEKKAITLPFWVVQDNGMMFSAGSQQALIAFSEERKFRNRQSVRLRRVQATLYHWINNMAGNNLGLFLQMPMSFRLSLFWTGYKFHWAVAQIHGCYCLAMLGLGDPTSVLAMAPPVFKTVSHSSEIN